MNAFQKQLLLKDDKSMAELSNPEREGVGQPLSPRVVSIEEFEDADADYASAPHPSAHYERSES